VEAVGEEVEHTSTAAAAAAVVVVATTVVDHSLDAQSCSAYSCEIDQLKRSADALSVERAERTGSEEADVEGAFESFAAESAAAAERWLEKDVKSNENFVGSVAGVEFAMSALESI
jgi:hypothetical protein